MQRLRSGQRADLGTEFSKAELGDVRLTRRLVGVADAMARHPSSSFPKIAGSEAGREALYRLLENDKVQSAAILEPHIKATAQRAAQAECVLAIHDTSTFKAHGVAGENGVGFLSTGKPGFFGHMTLAVAGDGSRRPLGVVAMSTVFRSERRRSSDLERRPGAKRGRDTWLLVNRGAGANRCESSSGVCKAVRGRFTSWTAKRTRMSCCTR